PAMGAALLARVGWALVRAAVLRSPGQPLVFEDRGDLQPVGAQRVVRVLGAGVCNSDLHMMDGEIGGPLPRVLGHEIAGHVAGIGNVLVYPCWSEGACGYCRRGVEQLCPAAAEPGWAVDGGFAGQVLVPHPRFLLPLQGLDPVRAAPLADAGVTPYRAVRRALPWLAAGGAPLVIGAGGAGAVAGPDPPRPGGGPAGPGWPPGGPPAAARGRRWRGGRRMWPPPATACPPPRWSSTWWAATPHCARRWSASCPQGW